MQYLTAVQRRTSLTVLRLSQKVLERRLQKAKLDIFIFEIIVICVEWLLLLLREEECLSNFVGEENRESVKEKREASVYA
jgi:hypothetical protein